MYEIGIKLQYNDQKRKLELIFDGEKPTFWGDMKTDVTRNIRSTLQKMATKRKWHSVFTHVNELGGPTREPVPKIGVVTVDEDSKDWEYELHISVPADCFVEKMD